jgi:glycosyltransferase involved in cell wall biosynthesis
MKVLFILKFWEAYSHPGQRSSGLLNSATHCARMLEASGIASKVVQVVDNNGIDREVALYGPTHVIIEALWVVPEKFTVLVPLHPLVKWIIRIHSKLPFLAGEGIAMDWILRYLRRSNVFVAFNDQQTYEDFRDLVSENSRLLYLPSFYPQIFGQRKAGNPATLNVACLGAIRPLKNHLVQALAAIGCARQLGRRLAFHINASRVEMQGENILKNLRALFDATLGARLVEHPWMEPEEMEGFLPGMDIGLQVSLSETFNYVAAEMVAAGVPVVVSDEIPWASSLCTARPADVRDVKQKMIWALRFPGRNVARNRSRLAAYSRVSRAWWLRELA